MDEDITDQEVAESVLPAAEAVLNYIREELGCTVPQTMAVVAVCAQISRFSARAAGSDEADDLEARLAPHIQAYVEAECRVCDGEASN